MDNKNKTIKINSLCLLLLFTFFSFKVIGQTKNKTLIKTYYDDWAGIVAEEFYVIDGDSARIDGEYKRFFPGSDNLIVKSYYKDGVLHGTFQEFYENGQPHFIAHYKNGSQEGAYTSYYVEGMKKTEAQFKNNEMVDVMKKYYQSGELQIKNDIKKGTWKEFYPTGEKKSVSQMSGEKKNGLTEVFDIEGNLVQKGTYKEGVIDGIFYTYFPASNTVKKQSQFIEGKLEGESKEFYETGKIKEIIPFENNKEHGLRKAYYPSGVLMAEEKLIEGKVTGNYKNYYENGQLKAEMITAMGKDRKGVFREFSEEGVLLKEGHMQQGKMHGTTQLFYEDGKTKASYFYAKGIKKGEQKDFYEDGTTVKQLDVYSKNATVHTSKEFYPSGVLKAGGNYLGKVKNGEWKTYYADGSVKSVKVYQKGFEEGEAFIYRQNGVLLTKERYRKGRIVGIRMEYHEDGKTVLHEIPYDKGNIYGMVKKYYNDGTLREIGKKYKEQKLGSWKYYDESGNLEKEEIYEKGKLLKVNYPNE
ncbi:toxin-antitoxin system YwqK family antitoxin [Flammeovirga aprica]|uniref:Toxin-antitoxin system YwqK family antitoxin n=1 Tax=Flammeovirga aprica JL-4 TaxID=694437 RepID=A0A7X9RS01_9BACT|nr:toxin-antitoxin system YwqK family antitoxin [Flammeovirga aprica]NME68418.1 toxin-antitoxin system YwqK family antitoxin [Flammeovirga aprica JL-4]